MFKKEREIVLYKIKEFKKKERNKERKKEKKKKEF